MGRLFAVGIGAGLVSALLFAVVVTGAPLGIVLYLVSPLPVLIAALGWHHRAGLVAALTGAVAVALAFRPAAGIAYAVASGLPAWWLAYLALLGRPAAQAPSAAAPSLEWFPLERLLVWVGGAAAIVTFVGAVIIGGGDHDLYAETLRRVLAGILRLQTGTPVGETLPTIGGFPGRDVVRWLVGAAPALEASALATVLTLNVFLAAKIVAVSGRLPRPWPVLREVRMRPTAAGLLGLAVLLALAPGYLGVAGAAAAGGIATAFAVQGLALLHDVTFGRPGRGGMLGLVYLLTVFFSASALPFLGLAGLADTFLPLRAFARRPPAGPGAPPRSNP